jgi:hypothetical protein
MTLQEHFNLGAALHESGDLDGALNCFRDLIARQPDLAVAHLMVGLILLAQGDYDAAWPEFGWRWMQPEMARNRAQVGRPMWDGGDLNGKSILLIAEGGAGDTLSFVRYLPLIQQRGARLLLACQPELRTLLTSWQHAGHPLPPPDLFCSLIDLPALFKTTVATIPNSPYVRADPIRTERWKARLRSERRLKIGLVWSGKVNALHRHLALADLAPLSQIQNVAFFSLQKGDAAREIAGASLPLTDYTAELNDFADTAALISNLDLVITVDTSIAHLSGAMGKPTWVMLKIAPDWRWMHNRPHTPWYPTARLFRQQIAGDWLDPIQQLAAALSSLATSPFS